MRGFAPRKFEERSAKLSSFFHRKTQKVTSSKRKFREYDFLSHQHPRMHPLSARAVRPISPEGVCGASPLAAPAGLSLRSAPRRAQRAASEERASIERGTSEHRGRRSAVRPSRCCRWSEGGRQAVGRCGRARPSRCGRQAVGRSAPLGRARPSAPPAGVGPYARGRTAAGGRALARASAPPRRGRGRGAPSPLLAAAGGAPPLIPARGGPRRSARRVRPLSCADVGGGAPSGLPFRPAPALGLFRAARAVLPPRARRARV